MRRGAVAARPVHTREVAGSSPAVATTLAAQRRREEDAQALNDFIAFLSQQPSSLYDFYLEMVRVAAEEMAGLSRSIRALAHKESGLPDWVEEALKIPKI